MLEIHHAAFAVDLEWVKECLTKNPDLINSSGGSSGQTPLQFAIAPALDEPLEKIVSVVAFLLKNAADVNATDKDGRTPLHTAAAPGYKHRAHKRLAEMLLDKGADVSASDKNGNTALHAAAGAAHEDMVEFLLHRESGVNAMNKRGETPLHSAACSGSKEVAELLLAKNADVNARNERNATPLHLASSFGHKQFVQYLVSKGADPSARDDKGHKPRHNLMRDRIYRLRSFWTKLWSRAKRVGRTLPNPPATLKNRQH